MMNHQVTTQRGSDVFTGVLTKDDLLKMSGDRRIALVPAAMAMRTSPVTVVERIKRGQYRGVQTSGGQWEITVGEIRRIMSEREKNRLEGYRKYHAEREAREAAKAEASPARESGDPEPVTAPTTEPGRGHHLDDTGSLNGSASKQLGDSSVAMYFDDTLAKAHAELAAVQSELVTLQVRESELLDVIKAAETLARFLKSST